MTEPRGLVTDTRWSRFALPAAALALVALAAWRATYGATAFDDSHYAAMALHLAQGGRPFADELSIQAPGFALAAPFAKLWTALFGLNGLVLALREYYIVLAALTGFAIYRLLRPSFGRVAAVAAIVPLLAVPYNIFGLSYNTSAILGFMLAISLAFAAIRDDAPKWAALSGAAAAFASISYPPLLVGGVVFVATFAIVARRRRLALWLLAGGAGVAALYAAWYFTGGTLTDIRRALDYSRVVWQQNRSSHVRIERLPLHLTSVFSLTKYLPVWLLAILAAVPAFPRRVRGWLLAAVPVAAVAPGVDRWIIHQPWFYYGSWPTASVIVVTLGLLLPIAQRSIAEPGPKAQLILLALPISLVNFTLVAISTTSGWYRGLAFVGLAPLAMALLAVWAASVAEEARPAAVVAASTLVVLGLVSLLATASFFEPPPAQLRVRMHDGPLAGIATTPEHAAKYEAIMGLARRYVRPNDRVLSVTQSVYFVLTGGRLDMNTAWWTPGPPEQAQLDYLERKGAPDVVFLSSGLFRNPELTARRDPLAQYVIEHYRRVAADEYSVVYVRR